MFVITGASGKTGGAAAEKLLSHGEKVRVIGRDATRLERFTQKGAEAFVADVTDAGALKKAFSGAKAVYAMKPTQYKCAGCSCVPGTSERRIGRRDQKQRGSRTSLP